MSVISQLQNETKCRVNLEKKKKRKIKWSPCGWLATRDNLGEDRDVQWEF